MADVAELQTRLEKLRKARSSGVSRFTYTRQGVERTIYYKTDSEMLAAISALESEIAAIQGATRVRNVVVRTAPQKGW